MSRTERMKNTTATLLRRVSESLICLPWSNIQRSDQHNGAQKKTVYHQATETSRKARMYSNVSLSQKLHRRQWNRWLTHTTRVGWLLQCSRLSWRWLWRTPWPPARK